MTAKIVEERVKKLAEMNQKLGNIDEKCRKLLVYFSYLYRTHPDETFGFNELLRKLEENRPLAPDFSRKTLSLHLTHLLKNNLIEVKEETESKLKIKPRKYKLSHHWIDLSQAIDLFFIPDYEIIFQSLKAEKTEPLTVSLLKMNVGLSLFMFRASVIYPKLLGEVYRNVCFELIENLMKAYQKVILERNDLDKSLKTMSEFTEFLKQEIEVKYGPFLKGVKF